MPHASYLTNADFVTADRDGAMVFNVASALDEKQKLIFDVRDEGDVLVIQTHPHEPATLLEADAQYPDTWKKSRFAELGKGADTALIADAEKRFDLPYADIVKSRRTIGAMKTLAFVFDDGDVRIAVVQRTSKGPDSTPNLGAMSRFGGGVSGGKNGKGVHGAQHLGNQTVRELMEEFHPYIRTEAGTLTPLDVIPQGYEVTGLKGDFMQAVMHSRRDIAARIDANLMAEGYRIGTRETVQALPLSIPGLTRPVVQIIDNQSVLHPDVAVFDAQAVNANMDFNTDLISAVRVRGVKPADFILKDGETDQKTGALLNRVVFFGEPAALERAVLGQAVALHQGMDGSKASAFSPAFKPVLMQAATIAAKARALTL